MSFGDEAVVLPRGVVCDALGTRLHVRLASGSKRNQCGFKYACRSRPLKLSTYAFCTGLPGSLKCGATRCWYREPDAKLGCFVAADPRGPTTRQPKLVQHAPDALPVQAHIDRPL